jgi:hypothetical protein
LRETESDELVLNEVERFSGCVFVELVRRCPRARYRSGRSSVMIKQESRWTRPILSGAHEQNATSHVVAGERADQPEVGNIAALGPINHLDRAAISPCGKFVAKEEANLA